MGRDAAWGALRSGANGIGNTQRCDVSDLASQVSGEVPEFDLSTYLDKKESRRMDRFTHLAIMAAGEAIDHSGLNIDNEAEQIGCMIGVGIGGMETLEREFKVFFDTKKYNTGIYISLTFFFILIIVIFLYRKKLFHEKS